MNETSEKSTKNAPQACFACRYLQDRERSVEYCQFHHVYVLRTYYCEKFVPRKSSSGGEAEENVHSYDYDAVEETM